MSKGKRKCLHIDSGIIYNSAIEMAKALNISANKVYKILKGRTVDSIGIEYVGESLVGTIVTAAKCIKCNVVKPREDFGIDKRTNSIRCYTCKKCRCKGETKRRVGLGKAEMRIRTIKSTYKVSRQRAEDLFNTSNCEVCDVVLTQAKKGNRSTTDRHIDHCHTTGDVRGVLCAGCNLALGHARESQEVLQKLIKYLNK